VKSEIMTTLERRLEYERLSEVLERDHEEEKKNEKKVSNAQREEKKKKCRGRVSRSWERQRGAQKRPIRKMIRLKEGRGSKGIEPYPLIGRKVRHHTQLRKKKKCTHCAIDVIRIRSNQRIQHPRDLKNQRRRKKKQTKPLSSHT